MHQSPPPFIGIIAWYRDRPEAAWTVTDADGKEVSKGRLPLDGLEHPLRIEVPRPGLYWFECNDQAAGWGIKLPAGSPAVLALRRGTHPSHLGQMQPVYFFVSCGTKQIQYHWDGPPHEVRGPDGKPGTPVTSRGKLVTIPVPEGSDGKAWSLHRLALGHLWFYNVPNYLAASPDALLVPREVVK